MSRRDVMFWGFGARLWSAESGSSAANFDASIGYTALTSATRAAAYAFTLPKSGVITKVGVYVAGVAGAAEYWADIQGAVSALAPDGASLGGSERVPFAPAVAGWHEIEFTTGATVVAGDVAVANIYPNTTSVTPDLSNYIRMSTAGYGKMNGFAVKYFTTSWTGTTGLIPNAYLIYADGTIVGGKLDANYYGVPVRENYSPNEFGAKITPPRAFDLHGVYVGVGFLYNVNQVMTIRLYDSADNILMERIFPYAAQQANDVHIFWDTPISLVAGSAYRVTAKYGATVSYYLMMHKVPFVDVAARDMSFFDAPPGCRLTERTGTGAWTDHDERFGGVGGLIVSEPAAAPESGGSQHYGFVS